MIRFSKNTVFCRALVAEQCDMRFLEIDSKTKILYIIECRGPYKIQLKSLLLFLSFLCFCFIECYIIKYLLTIEALAMM